MNDFLQSEEEIINKARTLLEQADGMHESARPQYAELLKAYEKLNKELRRLIRLSDRSQNKLNTANSKLASFSTKLSKYFSPQVYQSIFSGELDVSIQSKRKPLTIFFSDLQGFTELTERLEPEILTELLTNYLTEMSSIAIRWGGTIDKYIGDAILIFFGDPSSKGNKEDAINCVSMSLEMLEKMKELRSYWRDHGVTRPIKARIGIHSGICTVGNFGSEDRLDYTVIGNSVNLASRLETNARVNSILISEDTYLLIKEHIECESREIIKVKGVSFPVQTYEVKKKLTKSSQTENSLHESIPGLLLALDQLVIEDQETAVSILEEALRIINKNK